MKTFFIEIVSTKHPAQYEGARFLRAVILATDKTNASKIALDHYRPNYDLGGQFYVQCCWPVSVPKREVLEKHWRKYLRSTCSIHHKDQDWKVYKVDTWEPFSTKKEVLHCWDVGNIVWDDVYYNPMKKGYSITIQGYTQEPCEIKFFKGSDAETYKKAKQWVKENTFKSTHFTINS